MVLEPLRAKLQGRKEKWLDGEPGKYHPPPAILNVSRVSLRQHGTALESRSWPATPYVYRFGQITQSLWTSGSSCVKTKATIKNKQTNKAQYQPIVVIQYSSLLAIHPPACNSTHSSLVGGVLTTLGLCGSGEPTSIEQVDTRPRSGQSAYSLPVPLLS